MPSEPEDWHCIWVDDSPGPAGWGVHCIPHGEIGTYPTRRRAILAGYDHDFAFRGDGYLRGYA